MDRKPRVIVNEGNRKTQRKVFFCEGEVFGEGDGEVIPITCVVSRSLPFPECRCQPEPSDGVRNTATPKGSYFQNVCSSKSVKLGSVVMVGVGLMVGEDRIRMRVIREYSGRLKHSWEDGRVLRSKWWWGWSSTFVLESLGRLRLLCFSSLSVWQSLHSNDLTAS